MVHRSCFICSECKTSLSLGNFHTIDNLFYCTRHFFQRSATLEQNSNGRKSKARDLFAGSIDADPLLSGSLTDLEKDEWEKQDDVLSARRESKETNETILEKDKEQQQTATTTTTITKEENENNTPDKQHENIENKIESDKTSETEKNNNNDNNKQVENSKNENSESTKSISSDTEFIDLSDEDPEKIESDFTPSEKSEGLTSLKPKTTKVETTSDENSSSNKKSSLGRSTGRDRKKKDFKFNKKESKTDITENDSNQNTSSTNLTASTPNTSKKKSSSSSKKKKKSEKSEAEDPILLDDTPSISRKRKKDKTPRKPKKSAALKDDSASSNPVDSQDSNLDSLKDDKKKKSSKRGLFSLKKKPSRASLPTKKSEEKDSKDSSHSPSLPSFVTSRFRKTKKESSTDNLPIPNNSNNNSSPSSSSNNVRKFQNSSKYNTSKAVKTEDEFSDGEDDDLAPLVPTEKRNRISRLASKESVKSSVITPTASTPPSQTQKDQPKTPKVSQKNILPVSLEIPTIISSLSSIPLCSNTLEEV